MCTEMDQLRKFEQEFYDLSTLEMMEVANKTGCLLPCKYKEYQLLDAPITLSMEDSTLQIIRATKTVLVKTEEPVYPFESFLAEFGGALGLFLGFSFMLVLDFLQFVLTLFNKKPSNTVSSKANK